MPNAIPPMAKIWIAAIESMARSMNLSKLEAARLILQEFQQEAERLKNAERFGSLPDQYDPNKDVDHPQNGF